jgi:hypothetical protein
MVVMRAALCHFSGEGFPRFAIRLIGRSVVFESASPDAHASELLTRASVPTNSCHLFEGAQGLFLLIRQPAALSPLLRKGISFAAQQSLYDRLLFLSVRASQNSRKTDNCALKRQKSTCILWICFETQRRDFSKRKPEIHIKTIEVPNTLLKKAHFLHIFLLTPNMYHAFINKKA